MATNDKRTSRKLGIVSSLNCSIKSIHVNMDDLSFEKRGMNKHDGFYLESV
jgi:hypothetical protein